MQQMQKVNSVKLIIGGVQTTVKIPDGMQKAHGTGLDGKTRVESLLVGQSPEHPGKYLTQDAHGNAIIGTAHELFAAAQVIAQKEGFRLISTKA